jgi:arylsulfatase A
MTTPDPPTPAPTMPAPARPPNVVVINCDDLGYGDLGCYGSDRHDTPVLDRLAAEGARCTDFYMPSPVCSPSRAGLLTGSYPLRVGFGGDSTYGLGGVLFPGWGVGLHPDEVTIATLLRDAGYATLAVGKWHCGDQPEFLPTNHGFDEWFGLPYSNDMGRQVDPPDGPTMGELGELLRAAGIDAPWVQPPLPLMEGTEVVECQPDQAGLTARYAARCVDFIRANAGSPFFLYLAHLYVHLPIYVPDRFLEGSRNGPYGGAVACIDWATGVIVDELERLGLTEQTLIVFTSDNGALAPKRGGGGSNAPLRGAKGTTWEGGQRVPCIVRWPGHVPVGTVVDDVMSGLDLLPTLAVLAGVASPTDRTIDGRDVGGLLGVGPSRPDPDRPFLYLGDGSIEAVRSGRWKLHVRKGRREVTELYDLGEDPGETRDRAGEHPSLVAELVGHVEDGRRDLGDQALGIAGAGVRPIGRVDDPVPLTTFDPDDPYVAAEYDLPHRG